MPWLNRTVLCLGLVSFLTDASSEMILPLLPYFLAVELGAGAFALGAVEGLARLSASVLQFVAGRSADRRKRYLPWVLWGYGISSLVRPLVAFTLAPWQVIAIRMGDRVGKGLRSSPRDAVLAASVPPSQRGRAFGFHRGMDHAGAVAGPLVALLLLALAWSHRQIFLLALLPGLLALLLLVVGLRGERAAEVKAARVAPAASGARKHPRWWLAIALVSLAHVSETFFIFKLGVEGDARLQAPLLWSSLHVVKMLGALAGGQWSDRRHPRLWLLVSWFGQGLMWALLAWTEERWLVWLAVLTFGLFLGGSEAPERVLISRIAPPSARGSAFGAYYLVQGVAALASNLVFGSLWDWGGAAAACTYAAVSALAAGAMWIGMRDLGKESE